MKELKSAASAAEKAFTRYEHATEVLQRLRGSDREKLAERHEAARREYVAAASAAELGEKGGDIGAARRALREAAEELELLDERAAGVEAEILRAAQDIVKGEEAMKSALRAEGDRRIKEMEVPHKARARETMSDVQRANAIARACDLTLSGAGSLDEIPTLRSKFEPAATIHDVDADEAQEAAADLQPFCEIYHRVRSRAISVRHQLQEQQS